MEVQIVSSTAQKFNGKTYYLCGNYYQRKGNRLHRDVWIYHNGDIPQGYHIHHIDQDRAHNSIENLQLVLGSDHLRKHMSSPERIKKSKENIKSAKEAARKWHGSEAGIAFHSDLGKENWKKRSTQTYVCDFCGKEFQTKHIYGENKHHFCCQNCRASARRKRLKLESESN